MTEQVVSRTARDGRAANVEAYEAMKKLAPGWTAELGTRKATSPAHCFVGYGILHKTNFLYRICDIITGTT